MLASLTAVGIIVEKRKEWLFAAVGVVVSVGGSGGR